MSNLFSSSIGKKLIMSITGVFLVLFLLFHASMNMVAIFSTEGYDMICKFLGANWYALVASMVLAAGFVIHIIYALYLTMYNRKARGNDRYDLTTRPKKVLWASKNMFALGVIVLGFLVLHAYQFWAKMQLVELMYGHDWAAYTDLDPTSGSTIIKQVFANPIFALCYLIWIGALWYHLNHGFWSALQTIGWNNQKWLPRVQCISRIFATVVCLMFASVVVVFFLQGNCCGGACEGWEL